MAAEHASFPCELDLSDNSGPNFRTQFKEIHWRFAALSAETDARLQKCLAEDDAFNDKIDADELGEEDAPHTFMSDPREMERVTRLFDAWRDFFVVHMETMREIRQYTLKVDAFGPDENGRARKLKNTLGMSCFFELTRLFLLMHRPQLLEEMDNLACYPLEEIEGAATYISLLTLESTRHPMWVSIVKTFDVSELMEAGEEMDEEVEALHQKIKAVWSKPVMQYTQSECIVVILFLTQQMDEVPTVAYRRDPEDTVVLNVVEEYRRVFEAVWLRCGALMAETHPGTLLDEPEMRAAAEGDLFVFNQDFAVFCSIYLGEIVRRFFYYDKLSHTNRMSLADIGLSAETKIVELRESTLKWMTRVVEMLPEEAFEEVYRTHAVTPGYNFPGDDLWFKYMWPNEIHSRGACIAKIRPHLHKRFFSEAQINKHVVLASTKTSNVSRLFIYKALDEHLGIYYPRVEWINGTMVDCDGIEMSAYRLQTNLVPVLLQVFSVYWCYDRGRVYVCDDVYETLGVWFWLLHTRYGDTMYDVDLSAVVKQVLSLPN